MKGAALLAALALGGCISSDPTTWTYSPDEQTSVRAAMFDCKQRAGDLIWRGAAFGGVIVPFVGIAAGHKAYRACMEAYGYTNETH